MKVKEAAWYTGQAIVKLGIKDNARPTSGYIDAHAKMRGHASVINSADANNDTSDGAVLRGGDS